MINALTEIVAMIGNDRLLLPKIKIVGELTTESVQRGYQLMESNKMYGN